MQEYNEHVHVLLTTKSAEAISLLSSSLPSRVRIGSKPCANSSCLVVSKAAQQCPRPGPARQLHFCSTQVQYSIVSLHVIRQRYMHVHNHVHTRTRPVSNVAWRVSISSGLCGSDTQELGHVAKHRQLGLH